MSSSESPFMVVVPETMGDLASSLAVGDVMMLETRQRDDVLPDVSEVVVLEWSTDDPGGPRRIEIAYAPIMGPVDPDHIHRAAVYASYHGNCAFRRTGERRPKVAEAYIAAWRSRVPTEGDSVVVEAFKGPKGKLVEVEMLVVAIEQDEGRTADSLIFQAEIVLRDQHGREERYSLADVVRVVHAPEAAA